MLLVLLFKFRILINIHRYDKYILYSDTLASYMSIPWADRFHSSIFQIPDNLQKNKSSKTGIESTVQSKRYKLVSILIFDIMALF